MTERSKRYIRWPNISEAVSLLALTVMGLIGNYFNAELFFGVNFLFGSIATMVAVRTSGILWGTLVGIAIGSYTYVLWGHPYAIIIFGLEAFFVGCIGSRLKNDNLVFIDAGYWCLIGVPLVWVSYSYVLGLPDSAVTLVALKQMTNGIVNTALAITLVQFTPVGRLPGLRGVGGEQQTWSINSQLNTLLTIVVILPMLAMIIISGHDSFEESEERLQYAVRDKAEDTGRELASTLGYYSDFLARAAKLELSKKNSGSWKNYVNDFGNPDNPRVLNAEILSADGEILHSHPKQRSGITKYASQISFIPRNSHYLSPVHADGEFKQPHFTLIFPISEGHFLAASFSLKAFGNMLSVIAKGQQHIELVDGQGYILASSDNKDFSKFHQNVDSSYLFQKNGNVPSMVRWRGAYLEHTSLFMSNNDWTINVFTPMEKSIEILQSNYIEEFLAMIIILVISLVFVSFVSRALASPLEDLTVAAVMLANSPADNDVKWPASNIKEINLLADQFRTFFLAINEKQLSLVRVNKKLSVQNEIKDRRESELIVANQEKDKRADELVKLRVEQEKERKEAAIQIIHSSKLATLGDMATSAAHELNQPLNIIRMAAGNSRRRISEGTIDPKYLNEKLARIESQSERAAAIIDHMRMFGRESNEGTQLLDPRKSVTDALDLMGERLRAAGIEIELDLAQDCQSIMGYRIQLEQVILNLLNNARDAIAESEGEAKITLRVFGDDTGVHIAVEDTGGGIPEDAMPRIFEPFYTTKEIGKGTGLGLSLCYGIVRDMDGTIIAEKIDEGTRLIITLPVAH
jgi:C4-dicarboxylate-specific signal transduction histidine kinase